MYSCDSYDLVHSNPLDPESENFKPLAILTTTAVTGTTVSSATTGGNITSAGAGTVTARGVCWNTHTAPAISNNKTNDGSGTGSFTSSISGLNPNIKYYVRSYATNSYGTAYGNEISFTTPSFSAPTVTTLAATSVLSTTATLNGTVNANNSSTVVSFEIGLTTTYITGIAITQNPITGNIATNVSVDIPGLTPNQTYHYRIKAVNSAGTTFGADMTFTTVLTATDLDGNVYSTVTIGTQIWFKENLKTTKYNDGNGIPEITDGTAWNATYNEGYCWYNNNAATYKADYGALYNFYAVSTGKLCPTGWHVPTNEEWTTLTNYLGGTSTAGGKLKESGTTHWLSPNTGATNETGFSARPGGGRSWLGTFVDIGNTGLWWSSTTDGTDNAWNRAMYRDNTNVNEFFTTKRGGYSIRCIKDMP